MIVVDAGIVIDGLIGVVGGCCHGLSGAGRTRDLTVVIVGRCGAVE